MNYDTTNRPELDHPVIAESSVEQLNAEGYIDDFSLPAWPYLANYEIHPVFRRYRWRSVDIPTHQQHSVTSVISQSDFDLLGPVLRLASRILEHPKIVPFFSGLLAHPRQSFTTPNLLAKFRRPLYRFGMGASEGDQGFEAEAAATWKKMADMQNHIRWQFGGEAPDSPMSSERMGKGVVEGSSGALVSISMDYIKILRNQLRSRYFYTAWQLSLDEDAALLRTIREMAVMLCHEFCHALEFAYTDCGPGYHTEDEPFFLNDRMAEVGGAFEQQIFSGIYFATIGYVSHWVLHPFGTSIADWPGCYRPRHGIVDLELCSPAAFGYGPCLLYPIKMSFLKKFFDEDFWDKEISQHGLERLKAPRIRGVVIPMEPVDPSEPLPDLDKIMIGVEPMRHP